MYTQIDTIQRMSMSPLFPYTTLFRSLIPTCRDSTIEQHLANPFSGFHPLDLFFAGGRRATGSLLLAPHQSPRPIFSRELSKHAIASIVGEHPCLQIIGMPDVKLLVRILQNVDAKRHERPNVSGSRDRTRTCNPPVNSDLPDHCATLTLSAYKSTISLPSPHC